MSMGKKDASIETLRGMACLLLVMAHVIGDHSGGGLRVPDESSWRWFVDSLSYLRMPLFTFISGYVYALRPLHEIARWPQFMRGKARRLLMPMVFVGTFLALMQTYGPGVNEPLHTPWYLWNIVPISPFWFIWSIFWVFAIIAVIDSIENSRIRATSLVVAGIVMTLLNSALPDVGMTTEGNVLGLRTALYLGPFFIGGLLACRFSWRSAHVTLKVAVALAMLGLVIVTQLGVLGLIAAVPRFSIISTAVGILGCLSLLLLKWKWAPLAFVGSYSFTIYLFHVPAAVATRTILKKFGIDEITSLFVLCTFAGLAVPIAMEMLLRKNRWTEFLLLGQRLRPRPPSP